MGSNVVRELLLGGHEVRAFVREGADLRGLEGLDVELARGDVLDRESVERAARARELVFHLAAPYALWAPDEASIVDAAVRGTENVLRAASGAGARRVVLTGSCNAVGFTTDPRVPLDETAWAAPARSPYIRAKREQEARAIAIATELALDVVTVLPTAVLGPFDYRKTPTTAPFVDALSGQGPVPFPMNLVDVRDVARGHLLAAERGVRGERYLLGGDNVDMPTLAGLVERHTGKRPAEGLPPAWVLRSVAVVSEAVSAISKRPPMITRAILDDVAGGVPLFDITKAREKLGFAPRGAEEVVVATLRWALHMGWLPPKLSDRLRATFPPEAEWKGTGIAA